jgi:hypothetical protein
VLTFVSATDPVTGTSSPAATVSIRWTGVGTDWMSAGS